MLFPPHSHGWELGEHGEWCKRTNFEVGLRVPYMIRSPRHAASSYGRATSQLAESLDFYRTLAALALPAGAIAPGAAGAIEAGVEGEDLSPAFEAPSGGGAGGVGAALGLKTAAYSQMARCPAKGTLGPESACNSVQRTDIGYMGLSVRVDGWRYTAWAKFNGTLNRADFDTLLGEELYDHRGDTNTDFNAFENTNVVSDPENAATRSTLLGLLRAKFQ